MMLEAETNVGKLKVKAPMVDHWNPLFGIPDRAAPFVNRLNGYIGEWVEAAGTLQRVLGEDAPNLIRVAKTYRDANEDAGKAADQINR
ncbi:hypothetical protein ACFV0L_12125 [Streptosporangium canum]|uniref:hypothetical protein n=1 Tax=Streptosporangium canum TaxID=324952 RepID=UPI003676CA36